MVLLGQDEADIKKISLYLYKLLKQNLQIYKINVFEPQPAPIDKIQNKYRWRIIAKGTMTQEINVIINKCLQKVYDINTKDVSIYVDENPNNMM